VLYSVAVLHHVAVFVHCLWSVFTVSGDAFVCDEMLGSVESINQSINEFIERRGTMFLMRCSVVLILSK